MKYHLIKPNYESRVLLKSGQFTFFFKKTHYLSERQPKGNLKNIVQIKSRVFIGWIKCVIKEQQMLTGNTFYFI